MCSFKHLLLFITSFFIINSTLYANREVNDCIALSEKLNELGMFDTSFYLIDKTIRENPKSRDVIMVQKAKTYFAKKDQKEGINILKGIGSTSPAYGLATYSLGINYISTGKNEEGAKALEQYFSYVKNNMPKKGSAGAEKFQTALKYLIFAYKQDNKVSDIQRVMKYQEWPFSGETSDGAVEAAPTTNKYQQAVMNGQLNLDAAEMLKKEGKPGWKEIIEKKDKDGKNLLDKLKKVFWSGQTSYSAEAAIELYKAYTLLGKYDEAENIFKDYWGLIKGLDQPYREQGIVPPSSKAYLWKGYMQLDKGLKATTKDEKLKYFLKAANYFVIVISRYDQEKCFFTKKAVAGFNRIQKLIAEQGEKLEKPDNLVFPIGFDRKQADDYFKNDRFKECVPIYLAMLQTEGARSSEEAPDIIKRLAYAYLKTGKVLESLTLATYLGEYFPEDEGTPMALVQVGEYLWKEYEKSPSSEKGKKTQKEALMIYKIYLKNCPTHEYADEIAAKSAYVYFKNAVNMLKEADKLTGEPRTKKIEEARAAFKDAIPVYEHIIKNYYQTPLGKKSVFSLGECYTYAKEFKKGADIFEKYTETEYNREKKEERQFGLIADAKFRVASNYMSIAGRLEKEIKELKKQAESAPSEASLKSLPPPKEGKKVPMSEEALLKKIDETTKEAIGTYKIATKNLEELLNKWMKPGGRLQEAKTAKDLKKIKEVEGKAASLIAWAIDGTRNNSKAIDAFKAFLSKYPKHKDVPKAMLRLGMLYLQEKKPKEAAEVLKTLNANYPKEGKKALPRLAKSMYEIKEYKESIDASKKIFENNPNELPVSDLKWIATKLYDCGGKYPTDGAELALQACEILNQKLEKPKLSEWIGKSKAKTISGDKAKTAEMIIVLKDQMLFFTATAAFYAGNYKKAITALNKMLKNENSRYILDGHFLRAESFMKNNEPQKALSQDFNVITDYLNSQTKFPLSLNYKNQCKIGDTYVLLQEYKKALNAYASVYMILFSSSSRKEDITPEEKIKQDRWMEYAIFMGACCEKIIDKDGKNQKNIEILQDLYSKNFPTGKFKSKINNIPSPEEGIKLQK